MAPGTTAGVSAGPLPVPEDVQLLGCVLGRRQHVQVALLLTQPAGVLAVAKVQDSGWVNMHGLIWLWTPPDLYDQRSVKVGTQD